ncbi:MAG: NAD-dependent epimerase/dehydratase family protein [Alphaproteobacteria bacterium]|nr:NAD-dependent epimerase/dehydratase family protein [Alphaproteobacteria bacterium]MBU1559516.1 NAD-dependent epimerase/dehydratase family protein [Alphaproteobacteria bacterium]MBU2301568.1 NAD-dependent epimerase/dehydratase family protein [Alphaproteobacteria bacterium]MBU2369703.1 NAD-dependent epimerase/dehydratase family protein [Alphaproteobacteria bacterium]
MRIFITGAAGFIGFHLAQRLLADGHAVTGYDGMTDYYDPALKRARLAMLAGHERFVLIEGMLEDAARLREGLAQSGAEVVLHLAAQAGVRYSLEQPQSYIQSNVVGTANLLEALRALPPRHLIFASTSSIYGGNSKVPFAETDRADGPVSLYAATKKSGEAMVHAYAHLFGIPATCVRFFTVYGPWSRPDMAPLKFATAMMEGRPIDVYGFGRMRRDFTFVDDLVDAIARLMERAPETGKGVAHDSLSEVAPFRIVNIGGGRPTELMDFIGVLERALGVKAQLNLLPMQPGDVVATEADTRLLQALIGAMPQTPMDVGVARFVAWFKSYNGYA